MTLPPFAAGSVPPNTSFSTAYPSASSFMSRITPYSSPVATLEQNCTLDSASLSLSLAVFYSLFFVLGLVGNLFALWVFLFLHSKHNSVRVFLINCAVADLVLLACLPFRVYHHLNGDRWVLGTVACRLVGNGFYMNMYASILLLGLISLDRYMRLRGRAGRSLWRRMCGRKQLWSWVVCGTIWSIFLMGTMLMVVTKEDKDASTQCFEYRQRRGVAWKAYVNAMLVVLFWLVFIMMVISHAKIASKLLQLSQKQPALPNASKYKRTAKKSFFVLFLFTVCFVPYHIFRPVYIQSQVNDSRSCAYLGMVNNINEIMLLLSTFNSCLDPVMYFLLSGSVRRTALQVLGHRLCNRCQYLQDVTLNSSTIDYRRGSAPLAVPGQVLNNPSLTPRTSFCVINSTLRRTEATTTVPPAGLQ
ncbi:probable G-protein coupled receptor 34 [Poeciliopsis prolifica]|uniref:probable G-protein coupled receptor 34 n=1 Tax=Poeciliopsis prolifica TaxID=188132 RepID=UPI0024140F36|nr:probable G-protein coupled receptor 34 [Poeciliopsis prolifica]